MGPARVTFAACKPSDQRYAIPLIKTASDKGDDSNTIHQSGRARGQPVDDLRDSTHASSIVSVNVNGPS